MSADGDTEIGVEGPAGLKGYIKGNSIPLQVLTLIMLSFFFYWVMQQAQAKADTRQQETIASIKEVAKQQKEAAEVTSRQSAAIDRLSSAIEIQNYLSTLSQVEKEKFDLRRPSGLRDYQR